MNLVAALVALTVFVGLGYGAIKVLAHDGFPFPDDEDIAEYCFEKAGKRAVPGTGAFSIRASDCRWQLRTDPFG